MDGETHIGLGTLDHKLIVGATLAGYDATPDNATKLVAVARMQGAAARGPRVLVVVVRSDARFVTGIRLRRQGSTRHEFGIDYVTNL